jgi:hypothetical protein
LAVEERASRSGSASGRREDLAPAVGEHDEVHERGRLLQRLEHAVGRLVAQLTLDHKYAPAGLKGRTARRRDHRLVDVGDQDLVGAAGDHLEGTVAEGVVAVGVVTFGVVHGRGSGDWRTHRWHRFRCHCCCWDGDRRNGQTRCGGCRVVRDRRSYPRQQLFGEHSEPGCRDSQHHTASVPHDVSLQMAVIGLRRSRTNPS